MSYKIKKIDFILYMQGGIGNQLFQFSAAYAYSKKFNRNLVININKYPGYKWSKEAGVEINNIISNIKIMKLPKYSILFNKNKFLTLIAEKIRKNTIFKGNVYHEKNLFVYDSQLMSNKSYNGMSGYFQSYLYFDKYSSHIKNIIDLKLKTNTSINFENKIKTFNNSVAIHYRDYSDPGSGSAKVKMMMGDVTSDYYKKSILEIKKIIDNPIFFVFSNNINSAKHKFKNFNNTNINYFEYKSKVVWEDMALMSKCDHNIICNSSYSWWSAYLNQNKSKVVIAPKDWGNLLKKKKNNNLFPKEWILI